MRRSLLPVVLVAAACAVQPGPLAGLETIDISVDDVSLTVALADTSARRSQGLSGIEELPEAIDGMLFAWDAPISATFGMEDTLIPLEIWWFDEQGVLLGSAEMSTCPDGDCVSYRSPGAVLWALETPAGEWDFPPGAHLSNVE